MNDKPDYKNYTYTININPTEYRGVLTQHGVLYNSLPIDLDFIIEKKLGAMNGVYEDANRVLQRIKNERKD